MTLPSSDTTESTAKTAWNDCWNSIGVHGDMSCPKLATLIHCRNCPTYSAAASAFLDRDLLAGCESEWTTHFSQNKVAENVQAVSVAVFRVGREWFALPTLALEEVAESRKMHSVPHRRNGAVAGLVNIRGELIVCLSPQKILGIDAALEASSAPGEKGRARLLVVKRDGKRVAFPVDEVVGTYRCQESDFEVPPATVTMAASAFTQKILRWQGKVIGFLDDKMLVASLNGGAA